MSEGDGSVLKLCANDCAIFLIKTGLHIRMVIRMISDMTKTVKQGLQERNDNTPSGRTCIAALALSGIHRDHVSQRRRYLVLLSPRNTLSRKVSLSLRVPLGLGSRPVKKAVGSPHKQKIDSQSSRTSRDNHAYCSALINRVGVSRTT